MAMFRCSRFLSPCKESDVDEETDHGKDEQPAEHSWLALAIFTPPECTQKVHDVPVNAPECPEKDELLLSLFSGREPTLHFQGASTFHLDVGRLVNIRRFNDLILLLIGLCHLVHIFIS